MKLARLAGLLAVACLVVGLVLVSSASAGEQLFLPVGATLTATSGTSILTTPGNAQSITCRKDTAIGTITSTLLVGKAFVHYLECTSKEGTNAECTVKSISPATPGLILTKELHGILGLILPSREVGILFLPVSGKQFVKIEKGEGTGTCTPETTVSGDVIGLVEPTGKHSLTGKIIFTAPNPTEIDLTHGLGLRKEIELEAFSGRGGLSQEENVTFSEPTEVT